jgi:hypothetical protein
MNGVANRERERESREEEEELSLLSLLLLHHFQPSKFIIHRTRTNDRKNKFSTTHSTLQQKIIKIYVQFFSPELSLSMMIRRNNFFSTFLLL